MVEEINEIAIIFKRIKDENDMVEEFIPFKVVEGYFYEEEGCFIDTEQNVYSHMASVAEIGNVYAGRRNLYETIRINPNRNIYKIRELILKAANKYRYFKNINEDSNEYNIIKIKDKETGEIIDFSDKDTVIYYEIYKELMPVDYSHQNNNNAVNNPNTKEKNMQQKLYATPLEIVDDVKKTIKGQDEAIETIVSLLWMRYKYPDIPKSNILLLGPTGVGKTAIFNKLHKLLDVPLAIFGITGTSQSGYKGHDIEEMLTQLYYASDCDVKKAERGFVLVDEFDKLSNNNNLGEVGTTAVQNELLKIIEGCEREVSLDSHDSFVIDTTNITFVCCGAFEKMFEKKTKKKEMIGFGSRGPVVEANDIKVTPEMIVNEGIIKELVGRLPVIIKLNDLNKRLDILEDILRNSDESLLISVLNALKEKDVEVENLDDIISLIVKDASERKVGARGLYGPIRRIFTKVFYELDNNPGKYDKIIFGSNVLNDSHDFELVPKKVKIKTKKQEAIVE